MDPKVNVQEQVEIANRILNREDAGADPDSDQERLAELVLALDGWRRKGGFDPYTEHIDPLDPYSN